MWRIAPVRRILYGVILRFASCTIMSATETQGSALTRRPKRADARRNYDKLIAAGREAFTERDSSASLEDIARRAGVGIGTLYRHFDADGPDRGRVRRGGRGPLPLGR
jgi:hypothetical protein